MTNDIRYFFSLILIFSLLFFGGSPGNVYSHGDVKDEITFENFGVSRPKILPPSPFYFLKNLRRGFLKFFAFGAENKAIFEVDSLNELAAEIKALEEKGDTKGIELAIQNYNENIERLEKRIPALKDIGESPKIDKFLNLLAERFLKHEQLFDELKTSPEIDDDIEKARDKLEKVSIAAITKFDKPLNFKNRFENAIQSQKEGVFKEFKAIYALNRLENKLGGGFNEQVSELKDNLISKFEGRFRAEPEKTLSYLDSLSIDDFEELRIFDEIRERINDGELKSRFNIVRERNLQNKEIIREKDLNEAIKLAEEAVLEFKTKISSGEYLISKAVTELLERADFHLEQSGNLHGEGQYDSAFGQATAAYAAAKNGLSQLIRSESELEDDNFSLRVEFDNLAAEAKKRGFTRETSPRVYEIFDKAEKAIIDADTVQEVKDAKILLAEIEVLLADDKTGE